MKICIKDNDVLHLDRFRLQWSRKHSLGNQFAASSSSEIYFSIIEYEGNDGGSPQCTQSGGS